MFLVMVNEDNILQELVLVTTDRDKAKAHFFDTCSTHLSNWDEYTQVDKDALLDMGYEQFGNGKAVVLIDTDGPTSDDAIRDQLTKQPAGDVTIAEVLVDGELTLKVGMTVDEILEQCGRNLDHACVWDIQGQVVFKGSDGKWYTVTTESMIGECTTEFITDVLSEQENV